MENLFERFNHKRLAALAAGEKRDIYRELAAEEFNVQIDDVTHEQRTATKRKVYESIYYPPPPPVLKYHGTVTGRMSVKFDPEAQMSLRRIPIDASQATTYAAMLGLTDAYRRQADAIRQIDLSDVEQRLAAEFAAGAAIVLDSLSMYGESIVTAGRRAGKTETTMRILKGRLGVHDEFQYGVPAKIEWDDGEKIGRDGKPVKPEPYFRREARKGGKKW